MKILITGATGFVGRNLIPKLFNDNHDILELTRSITKSQELFGTKTFRLDITDIKFKEKILEVETTLALDTSRKDLDKINTKIIYSTLIEIEGDLSEKKQLEEIILIKVPTEVFSEIRSLFILLFEKSGFNQIKIDKDVDFKELYKSRFVQ